MEVEKRKKEIVVNLSREDVFDLQAGNTIYGQNKTHGDRPAVTMPDATVDVFPLSTIEEDNSLKERYSDDRLEIAEKTPLKGSLWPNGDLQIFVPAIKLTDVRLVGAILPREAIETPNTENRKGLVEHVIPQGGVRLNFGGSLKTVHIPDYFEH